ncbi:PREDICTED: cytochrome P450 4g15-like [Nicrophorus vespilloides]|uniref:Cytochrome P450 4g15-like n=1 Tax=Nicrophorus vespilloides TaxID=110193 RepID=A0ABM1MFY8_NICVS|nr:PREDICTED: cytochrome P450 4g15-like [Nicrophorus vespilloides]
MTASTKVSAASADSNTIYFLLFIFGFLFVYTYGRKFFRQIQLASKIPGPSTKTMVLTSFKTIHAEPVDMYKLAIKMREGYDDIVKAWFGPRLIIFLYHPADVETILSSSVHIDKSTEYSVFKPWFGNGLLISTGAKWKHHRKMIAPTFHQSILKNFIPTFYQNSLKVVEKMKKEIGHTFDCHEYMSGTTVDILLETAMGYKEPRSEETGFNYAMAVMKLCDILHRRHYKVWLKPEYIFQKTKMAIDHSKLLKVIMNLTTRVVKSKKTEYVKKMASGDSSFEKVEKVEKQEEDVVEDSGFRYVRDDLDEIDDNDVGEKKRLAFLDQLTANAQREDVDFTEKEVLDQVNTIMFEGHDTTAAGSSFALCLMGIHKDVQEKVHQEIEEIFQKSDRPCTFADTLEMKYLERVIMETLRMYPPVPIIARLLQEEVKLSSGDYTLPIGATVVVAQALLHRRPDSFPNPDVFNPDNFLPERCQERHYYSYVPFSAGPRSCVGRKYAMLKLKVLLSTIVRNYRIHSDVTEADFNLQGDIILKISGGFNIRLEPRAKVH